MTSPGTEAEGAALSIFRVPAPPGQQVPSLRFSESARLTVTVTRDSVWLVIPSRGVSSTTVTVVRALLAARAETQSP